MKLSAKELKKFQLKGLRRPPKYLNKTLSNFVAVFENNTGDAHCIGFSDALVEYVGTKLPRGVAEYDPAFLEVKQVGGKTGWEVWAVYYHDAEKVLLWKAPDRPAWLKPLKANNDVDTQNSNPPG